jgi:hypothetical protein
MCSIRQEKFNRYGDFFNTKCIGKIYTFDIDRQ